MAQVVEMVVGPVVLGLSSGGLDDIQSRAESKKNVFYCHKISTCSRKVRIRIIYTSQIEPRVEARSKLVIEVRNNHGIKRMPWW